MSKHKEKEDDPEVAQSQEDISESVEAEVVEVDPVAEIQAKYNEVNDKYLRLYSEFDNFRRRTAKEKLELMKTAGEDIFLSLLPILDDFERAMTAIETADDVKVVKEGIELIQNKLKKNLEQKGLKVFESKGEVFDAEIHDAITNIPAPTEDLKGKVVDVVEKGYSLNDKIIRHAKVVVGN